MAPILLLGFKRPKHLRQAIFSLSANRLAQQSDLYIAIDGPKKDSDTEQVQECREIALQARGFRNVETIFQTENLGLSKSVILNTTSILSSSEEIIVVEDDLIVSTNFLEYMNQGLEKYRENLNVASIHGYQYPIKVHSNECLFLRGTDCWGWGTWSDRWKLFNTNSRELLIQLDLAGLANDFNNSITGNNLKLLRDQAEDRVDSWAIRWHASMYLENRYTLFPPQSLVLNNGLDGSGTHEGESSVFDTTLSDNSNWIFPEVVTASTKLKRKIAWYFRIERLNRLLFRVSKIPHKIAARLFS